MSSATRLIQELRDARQLRREVMIQVDNAKLELHHKRELLRSANARIEEILEEMESGKSRTPLFDSNSAPQKSNLHIVPEAPVESDAVSLNRGAR